ncbi:DUF1531-domain-containing protein [Sporormia fimetaria CBS 119925]|uniref:DUF1531-domain-containing protein n=1 Tax=Sporormia fimetaria CBS 119925 TaxID=1340428 RepID=A0A6A6VIM6_9PLEO|nr:DUF1531-domain-containing protein [Sporormia fimetaria CBS 119925]
MSDSDPQPSISEMLATGLSNFKHNAKSSIEHLGGRDWIRIIMIVGTYLLIRPHLVKYGMRKQQKAHEEAEAATAGTGAEIHPNELRGGKKFAIPGVNDSEEEEEEAKPAEWGKKARVRQRRFIRGRLEEEERRLLDEQETESDKEIEELLTR